MKKSSPVVIAICVHMNTTVRASSFKIGLLQCMWVPYMVMLFLSLLLHVAMSEMWIWSSAKPSGQVSYGLLPSKYIDFQFTQHSPAIDGCLKDDTMRQHC